jgi:hypothetical protein
MFLTVQAFDNIIHISWSRSMSLTGSSSMSGGDAILPKMYYKEL